jgi:hypothetical protein
LFGHEKWTRPLVFHQIEPISIPTWSFGRSADFVPCNTRQEGLILKLPVPHELFLGHVTMLSMKMVMWDTVDWIAGVVNF